MRRMVRPSRHGIGRVLRWLYRERQVFHDLGDVPASGGEVSTLGGVPLALSPVPLPPGAIGWRVYQGGYTTERARLTDYARNLAQCADRDTAPRQPIMGETFYYRTTFVGGVGAP